MKCLVRRLGNTFLRIENLLCQKTNGIVVYLLLRHLELAFFEVEQILASGNFFLNSKQIYISTRPWRMEAILNNFTGIVSQNKGTYGSFVNSAVILPYNQLLLPIT